MGIRGWYGRNRADVLLAAVVLVLVGPVVQLVQAHQASRLALSAALVEQRTIVIDRYEETLGVDFAEREGHLLSDKAPGQPFLAAPVYAVGRALGLESAARERPIGNRTMWWVSLWSSAVPGAVLAVLLRRAALRVAPPLAATAGALAVATGSMLLPFSSLLFGHVLAALLGFATYLLARDPRASAQRLVAAGVVGGAAVRVEYTGAIVVGVVGVLALLRHRDRVAWFVAGGVPAAVLLGAYNAAAWGSPFRFSYRFSGSFGDVHATGLFGARIPSPATTFEVLVGERGLLTLTPVVLVGLVGSVLLVRRGGRAREHGAVALVVFALYALLQSGWVNPTGGASPGPRYVVPALPFLVFGVAEAFRRRPGLATTGAALGVVPMLLATFTNPLAQPTERWAVGHWVWRLFHDRRADTLLTLPFGDWLLLVQLALAAALAVRLLLVARAASAVEAGAGRRQWPAGRPTAAAMASANRRGAAGSSRRNSDGSVSSSSRTTGPRSASSTRSTRA